MKQKFTILSSCRFLGTFLALVVAFFFLTSCNDNSETPSISEDKEPIRPTIGFEFSLTLPENYLTREDSGQLAGTINENQVDIENNDFRILIFTQGQEADGSEDILCGELQDIEVKEQNTGNVSRNYVMQGEIEGLTAEQLSKMAVKLVVLANWKDYSQIDELLADIKDGKTVTLKQLWETSLFDFEWLTLIPRGDSEFSQKYLGQDFYIPLYGVTNPLTLRFNNNLIADVGEIKLLRALAKVEVISHENFVKIEDVRIRRYNSQGYSLPLSFRNENDFESSGYFNPNQETETHIPASVQKEGVIYLNGSENTNRWIIYVPEFQNKGIEAPSYLEIKFQGYDEYEPLYFCHYSIGADGMSIRGNAFDIVRNNWYSYTVLRNLQVTVDVMPYLTVDLKPEFGFNELLPRPPIEGELPPWVDIKPDED